MKVLLTVFLLITSTSIFAQEGSQKITCAGLNKKKEPCGMIVKVKGDYCRFHSPNRITCAGKTTKGLSCQIIVSKQGEYCWRHKK